MSKCPNCQSTLKPAKSGNIELDCCPDCKGIWFDDRELKQLDDAKETLGSMLPAFLDVPLSSNAEPNIRFCPKCVNANGEPEVLCRRSYDVEDRVEVEQCLRCSGIWLDPGELVRIRAQYETSAERNEAGNSYIDTALSETKNELKKDMQQSLQRWNEDVSFKGLIKTFIGPLIFKKDPE